MFLRASYRYCYRYGLMPFLTAILTVQTNLTFAQDTVQLKASLGLGEHLPVSVRKQTPIFIFGETLTSRPDLEVVIDGHAELRNNETMIKANRIDFNQTTDIAKVTGGVLINQGGNRFWGTDLELGVTDFAGFFSQPSYQFYKSGGQGSAERMEFLSERSAIAKFASYSTCQRPEPLDGKPWKPDWIFTADKLEFDMEQDVATASGAVLRFKDVPIVALPDISFPMSSARKSGVLAPSITSDNISGLIVTQPIYWNIAPNRDATFSPTLITNRGFDMGGEFRYLEANSSGTLRADYLPNDKLYGSNRWGYSLDQRHLLKAPLSGASDALVSLKLNRVSDDSYWRDFPNSNPSLTQRLLNNELNATSSLGGWATQFRVQRWQTLQDSTSPITPPFDRTQLITKRGFDLPSGLRLQLDGDITTFKSNTALTSQTDGLRIFGNAQVSRPWLFPSGYVTPKVMLNASGYRLDTPLSGFNDSTLQRYTPTFSVDSGLFFERDTNLFGNAYSQTLEPRIFYVRTPYHDQSYLPNYDSGAKDFSQATIYSENPFVGNDRIADMNRLTMGLTSKFLNPSTGAQALSLGVAQRFSFADQLVTLPGATPTTGRLSDMLVSASVNIKPTWTVDSAVQFGATSGAAERTTIATRYNPSNYRSFNAAYRMQQGASEQVDLSWQWPLGDFFHRSDENEGSASVGRGLGPNRWYSVARLNYSLFDSRLVNAIAGFEYDADCWVGRIVLEKTQLNVSTANQRIMFQIEFTGFARAGTSPLASLRSNIPRYQNLREQISAPSRFSQYD
jgi:LPS-assembly protein